MAKNFISGAIKHPGQLHRDLGVPQGQPIPDAKLRAAAAGRDGPKVAQRARFAETLKKMPHPGHGSRNEERTESSAERRREAHNPALEQRESGMDRAMSAHADQMHPVRRK